MTPDFIAHMQTIPGSCSPAVKASHWATWQAAQQALISVSGADVIITTLRADEVVRAEVVT